MNRTVMISQPMTGIPAEEIERVRARATAKLESHGYTVINNYFKDGIPVPKDVSNIPLFYMAHDIEVMSKCDTVYFCKGWENARGCNAEYMLANAYGLHMVYEED